MYEVGDIIQVQVSGIEDYGVFVKADNDYTGLIHISEIDNGFVKDINNYVHIGEVIYANVIKVDEEKKHLSLSIKNMNYNIDENQESVDASIKGFLPLSMKLDEWISDTLEEMDEEQKEESE